MLKELISRILNLDSTDYYPHEPRVYRYDKRSVDNLIKRHQSLIEGAYESLCFNDEDFDRYTKPLIRWLAEYILLLPASEYYHHTLPGSLFYHSLQTANYAAYFASCDTRLKFFESPQDRTSAMVFIPFAAWVSGLTHDISKAGTDMLVRCRDSKKKGRVEDWKPDCETLDQWCRSNDVLAYTAIYMKGRDPTLSNNLRSFYLNQASNLVSKKWMHYSAFNAVLNSSLDARRPLFSIVKKADQRSIFLDKNRYHKEPHIMRESSIFMSALQDMDSRYGATDDFDLYYKSDWGIHIQYPTGVRKVIDYINNHYSDLERIQVIETNNIDVWVNRLGNSFSLLQPHYQDPTFKNNQQIHPFVYPLKIQHRGILITANCITIKQFGFILVNEEKNTADSATFFEPDLNSKHSAEKPKKVKGGKAKSKVQQSSSVVAPAESQNVEQLDKVLIADDPTFESTDVDQSHNQAETKTVPKELPHFVNPDISESISNINYEVCEPVEPNVEVSTPKKSESERAPKTKKVLVSENQVVESKEQDSDTEESPVTEFKSVLVHIAQTAMYQKEPEIAKYFEGISTSHPMMEYLCNSPSLNKNVYICVMLMTLYRWAERKVVEFTNVETAYAKLPIYLLQDGLYSDYHHLSFKLSLHQIEGFSSATMARVAHHVNTLSENLVDQQEFGKIITNQQVKFSAKCSAVLLWPVKEQIKSLLQEGKVKFDEL